MTFLFDRPATSALGTRRVCDGLPLLQQGVRDPPFPAEIDVVAPLAVAGVPQVDATLADRHPRPPLGPPPVRAALGPGGHRSPLLHLDRLHRRNLIESWTNPYAWSRSRYTRSMR